MAFQWIANEQEHRLMWDQEKVIVIPREGNCEDTFEPLEEGAWQLDPAQPGSRRYDAHDAGPAGAARILAGSRGQL